MSHGTVPMSKPGAIAGQQFQLIHTIKWEHLFAGVCGGVTSTLALHPLDLIKVRFQVNEGIHLTKRPEYRGILDAIRTIKATSGFRGLYQGVTPNVWGAGLSWGLYFFIYNGVKTWMQEGNAQTNLGPSKHMLAAAEAGLVTLALTNPIWVTKTRLCLQYDQPGSGPKSGVYYKGMVDALVKIYQMEGVRGLYKGFLPGAFGVSHGALQFMFYEEMKTFYNKYMEREHNSRLGSMEYLTFAAISKIFAASLTYPYQVVRSRLQDQHREYAGIRDIIQQIWKFEGLRGFYKGSFVYLYHVTPNICIVFLIYEYITAGSQKSIKWTEKASTKHPKMALNS